MMVDREMSPRAFLKPYDVLTDRSYWTIPRRSYSGNSESGRTSFKKSVFTSLTLERGRGLT